MTKRKTCRMLLCWCCVLVAILQAPQFASADCPGQVIPSPNTGTAKGVLTAVAAVSPTDIWSVGNSVATEQGYQALIEHWDGTHWDIFPAATLASSS